MFEKLFKRRNVVPFVHAGDLPWNDPIIARRLLQVHLDQSTDDASRSHERILTEVVFIDSLIEQTFGRRVRVCDFTCGPGLYSLELARLGHAVTGIDYSTVSIEYARSVIRETDLPLIYLCDDVRRVEFDEGCFDATLFIYGQPNAFTSDDLRSLLTKIRRWTSPGGLLILELMPIWDMRGDTGKSWKTMKRGIFSDRPHLWLEEKIWHRPSGTQAHLIDIVDTETGEISEYSVCHTGYETDEINQLLENNGWAVDQLYGDLNGNPFRERRSNWQVLTARAR